MLKITTKSGQQVWWTADWHWNHRNLCRGTSLWTSKDGCRDFDTIEQMNQTIVDGFNSVVRPDDIVFNLGDVIFGDKTKLPEFLDKLCCKNIYLVMGNHDDWLWMRPDFKARFLGVFEYGLEVSINRRLFVLNHYSMLVWRDYHKGTIHLYGHSHGSLPDDGNARSLDIGVDTYLFGHMKFLPYSLDDVTNICYNLKAGTGVRSVDHHGRRGEVD